MRGGGIQFLCKAFSLLCSAGSIFLCAKENGRKERVGENGFEGVFPKPLSRDAKGPAGPFGNPEGVASQAALFLGGRSNEGETAVSPSWPVRKGYIRETQSEGFPLCAFFW